MQQQLIVELLSQHKPFNLASELYAVGRLGEHSSKIQRQLAYQAGDCACFWDSVTKSYNSRRLSRPPTYYHKTRPIHQFKPPSSDNERRESRPHDRTGGSNGQISFTCLPASVLLLQICGQYRRELYGTWLVMQIFNGASGF